MLCVTQLLFEPLPFFELFWMTRYAVRLGDSKFLVKFVESFFPFLIAHSAQPLLRFPIHLGTFQRGDKAAEQNPVSSQIVFVMTKLYPPQPTEQRSPNSQGATWCRLCAHSGSSVERQKS